jgi:predicted RNase H-like HicB family nuclease
VAVVVEKDEHGYFAYCPQLQGCYTQGDTYEEALTNVKDAVRLILGDVKARGEPVPTTDTVSLTTLEVAV